MKYRTGLAIFLTALAAGFPSAAMAQGYYYYECSFGKCELIYCEVIETEGPRGTTQTFEICSPVLGGGWEP